MKPGRITSTAPSDSSSDDDTENASSPDGGGTSPSSDDDGHGQPADDDAADAEESTDEQPDSDAPGRTKHTTPPRHQTSTGHGQAPDSAAQPSGERRQREAEDTGTHTATPPSPVAAPSTAGGPRSVGKVAAEAPIALAASQVVTRPIGSLNPLLDRGFDGAPSNAPENPLALTLMAIWRRLSGTFSNHSPVANPIQIGENAVGNVLGTLGAFDPDGHRLRYVVSQAARYGEVTVNPDGTYTYTPGFVLARDGGTDTFTVAATEVGGRLFSRPRMVSVPVTVTVGAGDALGLGGTPFSVVASTDGKVLYVSDVENNRVSVIDVATRSVTGSIAVGKSPYGMSMASNGRLYVVSSDDGTVSVIDTRTNTVVGTPIRVGNSPTSVAANESGTTIYVTNGNDDTVSVIDTATLRVTRIHVGNGPFGIAVSGSKIYVTNEFDNTVSVIDAATNTVVKTIGTGIAPTAIAVRGDRAVITNSGSWSVGDDGTVTVIDTTDDTVLATVAIGEAPAGVVINADATLAYVTDVGGSTVTVIDLKTALVVGDPLDTVAGAAGIAIGADGRLYVAGARNGVIAAVASAESVTGVFTPASSPASPAVAPVAGAVSVLAAAPGRPSTTSKGFDIYNLTTSTLTLSRFVEQKTGGRPEGGSPAEGYTIPPGGVLHFDVGVSFSQRTNRVEPVFTNAAGEQWTVRMDVEWAIIMIVPLRVVGTMKVSYEGTKAGTADPDVKDWFGSLTTEAYLYDKPGTKTELSGADAIKANTDLLNTVCESGRATCVFTPSKDVPVEATWTPFKSPSTRGGSASINNSGPISQSGQVKVVETEASKLSVEGSFKLSFGGKDKFGIELAGKIGREWTNSKTFEETTTIVAPPYTKVELLVRTPVLRVTGDMVIRVGNSTVTMKNITIDVPDVDRDMEKYYRYSPSSAPAVTV